MLNSGIYQIRNLINGKLYIGSSANIKNRWSRHKSDLSHNRHRNPKLQNAWNKYGKDNFVFEVIIKCPEEFLLLNEQIYITANVDGYNILKDAQSCWLGQQNHKIKGEGNGMAKLTEEDVVEIRRRCSIGHKHKDIAKDYGLSYKTITEIKRGKCWTNLPTINLKPQITDPKIYQTIRERGKVEYYKDIAKDYQISISYVGKICRGEMPKQ
jgi:group I intron endonuclease